ncbi:MAG: hypothetical protein IEMM0002_0423 [bacterium]|nr:MAG: hypothetical protein IEMM0002_0423 [bacterium]
MSANRFFLTLFVLSLFTYGCGKGIIDEILAGLSPNYDQDEKLSASDPQYGSSLGSSVALGVNYAVAGSYLRDGIPDAVISADNLGAAYVFRRTPAENSWDAGTELVAFDAAPGDWFGKSVGLSGRNIIVGAMKADGVETDSGAAYIYHRTSKTSWDDVVKISSQSAQLGGNFGSSVGISGDYAIVGASGEEGSAGTGTVMQLKDDADSDADSSGNSGAVYVFRLTDTNSWGEGRKITAPDAQPEDYFGASVGTSGEYSIVGAYGEDGGDDDPLPGAGAAYIFQRINSNQWGHVSKLTAPDAQKHDKFGYSVAVHGDYAVVGAPYENGSGGDSTKNSGAAYVFYRTDHNKWDSVRKLTASDPGEDDRFGTSVAINGDYIIVGAMNVDGRGEDPVMDVGAAYIFKRVTKNEWSQGKKILPKRKKTNALFGSAVGIYDERSIVGAPGMDEGNGAIFIFGRN